MRRQRREYPHVYSEIKRGRKVFYFRRGHGDRIRLREPYGSPAFVTEYHAALAGQALPGARRAPGRGTLRWLADQYRQSASWLNLKASSKQEIGRVIETALQRKGENGVSGDLRVSGIKRRHIVEGLNERALTPTAANMWLWAMKTLFDYGVQLEAMRVNPCEGVKRLKPPKAEADEEPGVQTWSEEDLAKFEAFYPLGTRERRDYAIMLYTGLRISDACRVGRQHVRDNVISITMEKTNKPVSMVVQPELAEALAAYAGKKGDLVWMVGARGRPISKSLAGAEFNKAAKAAGLVDRTCHGLRKAAARRYAEMGFSETALNSIFGWEDPAMAAKYVRGANRKRIAIESSQRFADARAQARNGNVLPLTHSDREGQTAASS